MATNNLLPFANGAGANVQDEATWSSLPDVATGFQSGLAVSKNFNRILAQGGAAGYAIGKVVVDWLGQDATIDATALGTNFEAALEARFGDYLPLAGGTMKANATIVFRDTITTAIRTNSSDTVVNFFGGNSWTNSAALQLYGANHATDAGKVYLSTCDQNTNRKYLSLFPNGSATWDGKEIERVDSSGSGWIRYASGIQIAFTYVNSSDVNPIYWTFPKAFSSTPVLTATTYGQGAINSVSISALSSTSVTLNNGARWSCYAIAIGYWK